MHNFKSFKKLCFWLLTHLTDVTVNMEAAVQSHYPDRLLLTLLGHDGLTANRTTRCIFPVREETSVRTSGIHNAAAWKQFAFLHTYESRRCSVSERWRPPWRGPRPSSSCKPHTWNSEDDKPSPWLAGSDPGWAWSTLNSALMYSRM